jgi:hypothetical protein
MDSAGFAIYGWDVMLRKQSLGQKAIAKVTAIIRRVFPKTLRRDSAIYSSTHEMYLFVRNERDWMLIDAKMDVFLCGLGVGAVVSPLLYARWNFHLPISAQSELSISDFLRI